jgi:hypothetical protein
MKIEEKSKRSTSIRIGTMTHYRLTQLSAELNIPIRTLIENAVDKAYYNKPDTVPVSALMEFIESYSSNHPIARQEVEQVEQSEDSDELPEWI